MASRRSPPGCGAWPPTRAWTSLRARQRAPLEPLTEDTPEPHDAGRAQRQAEAGIDAERLLSRLPPDDRLVMVLRHVVGLSFDEIADSLEIGLSAAKMRYQHALKKVAG